MPWLSTTEVERWLDARPDGPRLAELYALHWLVDASILSLDYQTGKDWASLVPLSPAGQELVDLAFAEGMRPPGPDIARSMFALFFHQDLLINPVMTDPERIAARLSSELRARLITWPYLFGRLLYDKFNDTVTSDRTDHLEAPEVHQLLEGTPVGVYQMGQLLTGPLGLLRSNERRFVPPPSTLPLWHCSDTGCGALHSVQLRRPNVPLVQVHTTLRNTALEKLGPASEWQGCFNHLLRSDRGARGLPYYDIAALIANAIIGSERVSLLTSALQTPVQKALRAVLSASGADATGAAESVAGRLTEAEQLQLLLILPDTQLIDLIDRSTVQGRIVVPFCEVRSARLESPRLSGRDRPCTLSAQGLRAKPRVPLAALHSIIWDSYDRAGLLPELGWKLRRRPDPPPRNALMDYIRGTDPRAAIKELIVSSMPIARAVAEALHLSLDVPDQTDGFADRLLWKLGFETNPYREHYSRLRRRLQEFSDTVLRLGDVRTEDDREKLRAIGVNLFVSVEAFLSDLISFNSWFLGSDHFVDTRFVFDSRVAVARVPTFLGASLASGDTHITWNNDGANTLGTLLVYLQRLSNWSRELTTSTPLPFERPQEDLPHFADDPEQAFVFRHTTLWADSDPSELAAHAKGIETIVEQLNRADLAGVRNGLDHKREERQFPSTDVMIACTARLRDAFDYADLYRFIPKEYWLQSRSRDRHGKQTLVFADYQGREVSLGGPSVISGLPEPVFRKPVIIGPGNPLGFPHAELRFEIREPSHYATYWAGYPRRRRIPSPHRALQKDETLSRD